MRRALLIAAALTLFMCTSAFADSGTVNYTGNVNLGNDPGFSFSFSEPGTITSLITTTTITITQGPLQFSEPNSEVEFWSTGNDGLFDLEFSYLGSSYDIGLYGAQSYSTAGGSYKLLTGQFPITGGYFVENGEQVDYVTGGKVTAKTVPSPEPAGIALLGLGIAALAMLRKKQLGGAAV
jgi:hypothetical protein